jgi:hypothetical protein
MPAGESRRDAQAALPDNIQELYQQILLEGYILVAGETLTQQIAQEIFPEPEPGTGNREPEARHPAPDIEPER